MLFFFMFHLLECRDRPRLTDNHEHIVWGWLIVCSNHMVYLYGSNVIKQCHKPPIWEWFIPPIYGDLGDGLWVYGFVLTTLPHFTRWRFPKSWGYPSHPFRTMGFSVSHPAFGVPPWRPPHDPQLHRQEATRAHCSGRSFCHRRLVVINHGWLGFFSKFLGEC